MENISKTKKILYWAIGIFVFVAAYFLTPMAEFKRTIFPLIALLGIAFLALGAMLTNIARKETGKLKIFLMMTGISAMIPALSSVLHNLLYALSMYFQNFKSLLSLLGSISFIIALIIAPLVFIVGAIGTIVLLNKKEPQAK